MDEDEGKLWLKCRRGESGDSSRTKEIKAKHIRRVFLSPQETVNTDLKHNETQLNDSQSDSWERKLSRSDLIVLLQKA